MYDDNLFKGANSELFHFARQNRKIQTKSELLLWERLRNRKLKGFKFRRQHPISNFIADFYCVECNLVIELDGDYHQHRDQSEYDQGRTYELEELNLKVVRFTNREVIENIELVLEKIVRNLR